jgi:hypothetical protein
MVLVGPGAFASTPTTVVDIEVEDLGASVDLATPANGAHQVSMKCELSEFGDWRPPSRALQVTIYKAWNVYVTDLDWWRMCMTLVLFQSKHQVAEGFINVHGRNM